MPETKLPFRIKIHREKGQNNQTIIVWSLEIDDTELTELGKDIEIIINYGGTLAFKDAVCPVKP